MVRYLFYTIGDLTYQSPLVVATTDVRMIARWNSVLSGSARKSDVSTSDSVGSVPTSNVLHTSAFSTDSNSCHLCVCVCVCVFECRGVLEVHGATAFIVDSGNGSRMFLQYVLCPPTRLHGVTNQRTVKKNLPHGLYISFFL